jgi:hypothetical protein
MFSTYAWALGTWAKSFVTLLFILHYLIMFLIILLRHPFFSWAHICASHVEVSISSLESVGERII